MLVELDHKEIVYSGRIDFLNTKKPEFIFPASFVRIRFCGRRAAIIVRNHRGYWCNSIGTIIDKVQNKWELNDQDTTELVLLDETCDKIHEIMIFKRQDSCHVFTLERLELSDGAMILPIEDIPKRRIEVYGDSVSAGEVSEAVDFVGMPDPEHQGEYSNSWYSYAWMTARKLKAQLQNISQGGIPLLEGTGWVAPPEYLGMEFMWDKLHYHPQLKKVSQWDFSKYTPHLVIVAIGQNDSHPDDYMKTDYRGQKAQCWRKRYQQFLVDIREKYPTAIIILTTTILEHDPNWDKAIEEVCREINDPRVKHFLYKRNGCGTPGHPRILEQEEMAEELIAYINGLDMPIWEDELK